MSPVQQGRLVAVQWQDLRHLSRFEVAHELLLSPPWLLASWCAASFDHYLLALGCSFMFFVTGLRQVHNAYHVEHHLFPAVPTRKLPVLAQRLDLAAPELVTKRVF